VNLRVPKLRRQTFETAIIERLRVSRDREHGFQRIVSNDFRGS
jgi:transposase-like protein